MPGLFRQPPQPQQRIRRIPPREITVVSGSLTADAISKRTAQPYVARVIADAPLAYWRLGDVSGDATDSSGNGHTLTANGSITHGVTGALSGDADKAMTFNGTNQWLQMPYSSWMNVGDVFTLECWVRRLGTNSFEELVIVDNGPGLELRFGVPYLRIDQGSLLRHASVDVLDGAWHHVVGTKNGSTAKVYVDGVDVTVFDADATVPNGSYSLNLAAGSDNYNYELAGSLDEVAFYNYALTSAQVKEHYLIGTTGPGAIYADAIQKKTIHPYVGRVMADAPAAYWRMGESSGNIVDQVAAVTSYSSIATTYGVTGALTGDNNTAITLDGIDDEFRFSHVAAFNLGDVLSIECWVKVPSVTAASSRTIIVNGQQSYQLSLLTDGTFTLVKSQTALIVTSTVPIPDTTNWHHLVATKNGATSKLYLDGVDVSGTVTNATMVNDVVNDLVIAHEPIDGEWFAGSLDEIALYNYPLTGGQVATHFALGTPYRAAVVGDGAVGYWRLGEPSGSTTFDSSGHGNDGTYGTAGSGTVTLGQVGALIDPDTAAKFFSNAWVDVVDDASLHVTDFSWEAWLKRTHTGAFQDNVMAGTGGGAGFNIGGTTADKVEFYFGSNGGYAESSVVLTDLTKFYHIVCTYKSSTGVAKVYVDGVDVTTIGATIPVGDPAMTGPYTFASVSGTAAPGTLDEIALYNTALTQTQVTNHYQRGRINPGTIYADAVLKKNIAPYVAKVLADAPVSYWRLGEASGNAADSADSNTGTPFGTPTYSVAGALSGDSNTAISFAGAAGDRIDMTDTGFPTGSADRSVEMWIKTSAAGRLPLFWYGTGSAGQAFQMELDPFTGLLGILNLSNAATFGSVDLRNGAWHHVVITLTASSTVYGYVDGVQYGPTTVAGWNTVLNNHWIGTDGSNWANGVYDEVAIYSYALSAAQIKEHYRVGTTGPGAIYADAVLASGVATVSSSFTANAVLKKTISATLTADSVLKKTISGSFTANAVLKKTISSAYTGDAVFKKTISGSFTEDAVLKKTLSFTFTADSVLLKTRTATFTADAWLLRVQTGAFTANAVLKKTLSSSVTGDAVLKRTISSTFTADAVIKRTQTGTFTGDAVLKRNITGSLTADAVLKKTLSFTLTADAVLLKGRTGTFTADAWLLRVQAGSLTGNAVLKRNITGSAAADAVLKRTITGSLTADAVLKRTQSASFAADAVLKRTISGSHTADSVLLKTRSATFTADAILRRTFSSTLTADAWLLRVQSATLPADAVIFRTQTGSFTANAVIMPVFRADAIIKRTQTGTLTANAVLMPFFRADAVLRKNQTSSFTADSFIAGVGVAAISADAVIFRTQTATFTANAVLFKTQGASFSANAVLQKTTSVAITADAVIKKTLAASITGDAVLLRATTSSITADAVLKRTISSVLTGDAVLKRTISGNFSADSVLKRNISGTFTCDAVIARAITGSFTANAVQKKTQSASFTGDSVLLAGRTSGLTSDSVFLTHRTGSFTADASISGSTGTSFTANAIFRKTFSSALTADAVLYRNITGSITANAVLKKTASATFTGNAVLFKTQTATFTANAVLRRTSSAAITADAYLLRLVTGTLTANAVIKRTISASYTANAVLKKSASSSFTADSFFSTSASSSITADAVIKRTQTAALTANAVLQRTLSGSYTADAFLLVTRTGSFTADARLVGTVTATFTADAVFFNPNTKSFTADAWIRTRHPDNVTSEIAVDTISGTIATNTISATITINAIRGDIREGP